MVKLIIFLLYFMCFNVQCSEKKCLNIAVSSNFLLTFNLIVLEFEKKNLCKVNICSDSTGNLYNKIKNKAPFDVFISADSKHPILLEKFIINKSSIYAYGALAVFNKTYKIKKNFLRQRIFFSNVVISNKLLSPYGYATYCICNNLHIIAKNIIVGLNLTQTYNFVENNSSCCGFVALSQVLHKGVNNHLFFLMPEYIYPPIEQRIIFLKDKNSNTCLYEFFKFFNTEYVKNIILKYGYKIDE